MPLTAHVLQLTPAMKPQEIVTSGHPFLLLIGNYSRGEVSVADQVAQAFGGQAKLIASQQELGEIADCERLRGILMHPSVRFLPEAYRLLGIMQPFVPIVETTDRLCKASLLSGLRRGAVDVVERRDLRAMSSRMQTLCSSQALAPALVKNREVLVAHEDEHERLRLLRAFRMAGYRARPAWSPNAARLHEGGELLVISESMWFEAKTRSSWHHALILSREDAACQTAMIDRRVALVSEKNDAQQIVLIAQQLAKNVSAANNAPIVLNGCVCSIRVSGRNWLTTSVHRMSEDGLFVRTLADTKLGSHVWIELDVGKGDFVNLRGKVTATRSLSALPSSDPPGFELALDMYRCPHDDLSKYKSAYKKLMSQTFGDAEARRSSTCNVDKLATQRGFASTYHLRGSDLSQADL